jgi:hypothetical protein
MAQDWTAIIKTDDFALAQGTREYVQAIKNCWLHTYLRPTMSTFSSSPSTSAKGSTSNSRRRWLSLAKPALGVALAMAALTPGQAQAVVVNVDGQDWDVTTFSGGYYENSSKFETPANGGVMPWWNNHDLAYSFTAAVSSSLGDEGPYFAYYTDPTAFGGVGVINQLIYNSSHPMTIFGAGKAGIGPGYGGHSAWAQATPYASPAAVPGPLPALGVAAGFGFSRKLRKRINRSAITLASA